MNLKSALLFACIVPLFVNAQKNEYTIKGKIGKLNSPAKAYLMIDDKTDSAIIKNGVFVFRGVVDQVEGANLLIDTKGIGLYPGNSGTMRFVLRFYIEPGVIAITSRDSARNATVVGGPINKDYTRLKAKLKSSDDASARYVDYVVSATDEQRKSTAFWDESTKRMESIGTEQKKQFLDFIRNNPNSVMSLLVLKSYAGFGSGMLNNVIQASPTTDELDSLYNSLTVSVRSTKLGFEFAEVIARQRSVKVGAVAPDFSQTDTSGNLISLKDFKSKYLLIDFWASWCGPCRAENPNVVKAYNNYKSKGFTVLGVSLDFSDGKDKWMRAIHDDKLAWAHVSGLKGWKNRVAQLYSVMAIPQNFLIDPDGKIIAMNLRGDELDEKLKELLDAKTIKYVINGKVRVPSSSAKVYLIHQNNGAVQSDSAILKNGEFTFSGSAGRPDDVAFLTIKNIDERQASAGANNFLQFYTDAEKISIISDSTIDKAIIIGGMLNRDEADLKKMLAPVDAKIEAANRNFEKASAKMKTAADFNIRFDKEIAALENEKKRIQYNFIKDHPNSLISLNALIDMAGNIPEVGEVEPIFSSLAASVRLSPKGMEYATKIAAFKKLVIGAYAPDFTMPDTAGRAVSLRDFKGKYVLLDFWASWCPPCRAENPNVVQAYNTYRNNNFTVVGVSLDHPGAKNKWLAAIHADRLNWTHISDLEYDNAVAKLYSVTSIPQNFLIDPNGKIIAKNLRGSALQEKLSSIFGQ